MHEFGSPKLKDPTSELERAINTSFDRLQTIVEDVIPQVVNRPLGSEKVPIEQLKLEYRAAVRGNVQGYNQKLADFVGQEGDQRGLEMFISYVEAMEK